MLKVDSARNIPSYSENGLVSVFFKTYTKIYTGNKKIYRAKSKVIRNTSFPVWNQKYIMY